MTIRRLFVVTLLAAFVVAAGISISKAQTNDVTVIVNIRWVPPTVGCTPGITPCDNVPLTGIATVTYHRLYYSTAPIPDTATTPTKEVKMPAVTDSYTTTGQIGGKIYARLKACNSGGCGVLSNEGNKPIEIPVPNPATGVSVISITIIQQNPPNP